MKLRRTVWLRDLARTTPRGSMVPLIAGIFVLFSTFGFITDIMSGGRHSPGLLASNVLFSGSIALLYLAAAMYSWWLVPIGLAIQLTYSSIIGRVLGPQMSAAPDLERLTFDGVSVLICVSLSYALFLKFINTTVVRFQKVRAEIQLAQQIHAVLVPPLVDRCGRYEFFGTSAASGEVGGDLVDLVRLESGEERWIGYVADVSGHGVSSGVLMGMTKSAARMRLITAPTHGAVMPSLLRDLNDVLYPLKSPSMFVTLAAVVSGGGDELEFAVAGHLPILRVAADGAVTEHTTSQIAVGMFEDQHFTGGLLKCAPGDLLAIITDGLTEVFDSRDEEFGLERVKALLARHRSKPLAEVARHLLEAVKAHGRQIDDQTLLLIRRAEN